MLLATSSSFTGNAWSAERLASAISADVIDWERCVAFADGQEQPAPGQELLAPWLGLSTPPTGNLLPWSTGPAAAETRHFRIVFKQPVEVGTLCASTEFVALLRDDSELPGVINDESQWRALAPGMVRPLDLGTKVRAIRITIKRHNLPWENPRTASVFPGLRLFTDRYYNPAEFGYRDWSRPAVKKGTPAELQWLGYWPEPQLVAGILIDRPGASVISISAVSAKQEVHPRLAQDNDWQPIAIAGSNSTFQPQTSLTTRAVRLRIPVPTEASIQQRPPSVAVLVSLPDDANTPTSKSYSHVPASPVTLKYDMPLDGFAAIRIEDEKGQHVRRLIAEVERERGSAQENWDLLDDQGKPVAPGKYHFVGLARPPFKLTYEMTVYNAGNPPWMAPVPGGGWWMADHGPPCSTCAVGDVMFFGAGGAEFGVPLIATDREGRKLWHDLHQGAQRLVSDGRYAYVVNDGEVIRIDPQNKFAKLPLHKFAYSTEVPGHAKAWLTGDHSGAAVFGNALCISYSAPAPPWIRSAFHSGQVNIAHCQPSPIPHKTHVTDLTPNEHIFSTFQAAPSSVTGSFGPTSKKGPLKDSLLLTLKDEVPVGSVVVPSGDVEVYALKSGVKLPEQFIPQVTQQDPTQPAVPATSLADDLQQDLQGKFDPEMWLPLRSKSADRPGIATSAQGMKTKALIFHSPKQERLEYSLVLDRRYRNATESAVFLPLEGMGTATAAWQFNRAVDQPLSYGNPAVAGYIWKEPAQVRGFLMTRPTPWAGFAIDVWNGPADASIDAAAFKNDEHWQQVHLHRQVRNDIKWSWHTPRVVQGDFGSTLSIRALRVRVIDPPQGPGAKAGPVNGGFESLLLFEPQGNDAELPVNLAQRITVLDLPSTGETTAKLREHLPVTQPGALAFDAQGKLYVACEAGICRLPTLDAAGAATREVVVAPSEAGRPRALAFDAAGLLWGIDGKSGVVRAYDVTTGKRVRELGKAGPKTGLYNPQELTAPAAMSIDAQGKLWLVEQHFQPKRISRWSTEGQVEKELFGPTHYGGGGMLDPRDKSVINHLGMKFRIDYATRTWKLESRLAQYSGGNYLPDRVTYVQDRRFLVGDRPVVTPFGDAGPTAVICEEVNGEAVTRVAAGLLGDWRELPKNAALKKSVEKLDPSKTVFIWSDQNADRQVQPAEVRLLPKLPVYRAPHIGDDLSLNFPDQRGGARIRLSKLVAGPNGASIPDYTDAAIEPMPGLTGESMVTPAGETFVMNHKLLDSQGKQLWTYPDRYMGVQASNMVPWGFLGRPAGTVAGSIGPIGHFKIGDETIFCVGGNSGDYYAFTLDGLLAGAILGGPKGYGRRYFSMPECEPGKTDLSDLRKTVEDFHGHVTKAEDGKVYAIAGKNHVTLMRVDGFEQLQRFSGDITVTSEDLPRTRDWTARKSQIERFLDVEGPKRYTVLFAAKKPTINGDFLTDWPAGEPLTIRQTLSATGGVAEQWQARLAFDKDNLYIGGTAIDSSPLVNSAEDAETLFQSGDAFDLHLGLDPKAPAERTEAAVGDVRLLVTYRGDRPTVMLYRYVKSPGSPPQRIFQSPVGETAVAEIREIKEAEVAVVRNDRRWTLEAAIPWRSLGMVAPTSAQVLRGDVGALESDPNGRTTIARHYWANKRQVFVGDQPTEARLLPSTWGEFEFPASKELDSLLDLDLK
ncbi:hypothetical protein [Anatilimnocola aggregata]|nr:hypothetical protein [Anatilimnocola aggregata]